MKEQAIPSPLEDRSRERPTALAVSDFWVDLRRVGVAAVLASRRFDADRGSRTALVSGDALHTCMALLHRA